MAEPKRIDVMTLTATPINEERAVVICVAKNGEVLTLVAARAELARLRTSIDNILKMGHGA